MADFTKEEIVNSINCCLNSECKGCSFNKPCVYTSEDCMTKLLKYALSVIKTQDENSEKVAEEIGKLTHALRNKMISITRYVKFEKSENISDEVFADRQVRYKSCAEDAVFSIISLLNDNDTLTKIEKGEVPETKSKDCGCKRKIAEEIKEEINEALKSNFRAREERMNRLKKNNSSPSIIDDDFISYCNGKIDALTGIADFVDELIEKM